MKTIKNIITLLFFLLLCIPAVAQQNIERELLKIEGKPSTQYCAYSERRDPQTHKIVRASKVMVIPDGDASRLRRAMDRDRDKAVSCDMVDGGKVYELTFLKDRQVYVFTLVKQSNGTWLFTSEIYPSRRGTQGELDPNGLLPSEDWEYEIYHIPVLLMSSMSMWIE